LAGRALRSARASSPAMRAIPPAPSGSSRRGSPGSTPGAIPIWPSGRRTTCRSS
jgi:hypothetical protein